ncbi:hypothetical protein M9H77_30427 [Catharanthus roseus]|uniref:Uncharacterized protein n=1 Tax=Catharanthus roseus TaxID=4058 RepID=A0ACB9ZZ27_CATRO|nr:hypothetical protein M9H77_30427 [Catharanthus roseus]
MLDYKSIKTINFFPPISNLRFEIYFKEIKLSHLFSWKNRYQFYFLNSLGTLIEKKQLIEFNSNYYAIPRIDECHFDITNYASCVLGVEDEGRSIEKELGAILEELSMKLSLIPSLMCYEVSFYAIKEFLLKDFENRMGNNLKLFQVNPLAFEKSNLKKEAFEQSTFPHLLCKIMSVETHQVSFQGFQVGENMMQAIQDWLISKNAFEEKSFHGHVLCLDEKMNMKLIKYNHSKNHDIVPANNKKFGIKRFIFDPGGWIKETLPSCSQHVKLANDQSRKQNPNSSPAPTITCRLLPVKLMKDGTLPRSIVRLKGFFGANWGFFGQIEIGARAIFRIVESEIKIPKHSKLLFIMNSLLKFMIFMMFDG